MPWRAVMTRPVPRPATAGPAPPAAHLLFPPGREHQHPGGEPAWPACSPPAGRIGRPSCGGAGRSVNCSGPGISAALDLPEDQPNPGIPQVKAAQGMPAGLDLRRTLRGHLERHQEPPAGGARDMTARILSRRNRSVGSQQPTQPGQRRWPARAPPANRDDSGRNRAVRQRAAPLRRTPAGLPAAAGRPGG
jgi:hypothetical protein